MSNSGSFFVCFLCNAKRCFYIKDICQCIDTGTLKNYDGAILKTDKVLRGNDPTALDENHTPRLHFTGWGFYFLGREVLYFPLTDEGG